MLGDTLWVAETCAENLDRLLFVSSLIGPIKLHKVLWVRDLDPRKM